MKFIENETIEDWLQGSDAQGMGEFPGGVLLFFLVVARQGIAHAGNCQDIGRMAWVALDFLAQVTNVGLD